MPQMINAIHKYKPRGSWQQRPVKNIQKLVVHHSAADASDNPEARLNEIMGWHLANSSLWMGLSYHYVITKNGQIYQTNNHCDLTWHDGTNSNSLGILVDGYFHKPNYNQPTPEQLESLEWLLYKLCTEHPEFPAGNNPLQDIVGHRDVAQTACPGDILYPKLIEIKQKINQKITNPQPAKTPLPATNPPIPQPTSIPVTPIIPKPQKNFSDILEDRDQEISTLKARLTELEKNNDVIGELRTVLKSRHGQQMADSILVENLQKEIAESKKEKPIPEIVEQNSEVENSEKFQSGTTFPKGENYSETEKEKPATKPIEKDVIFGFIKNQSPTIISILSLLGYNSTQDQVLQSGAIIAPIIAFVVAFFMEKIYKFKS